MKFFSLFLLATVFYTPHLQAHSTACEGPEFTEDQLREIVRKERIANPKIPRSQAGDINAKLKVEVWSKKCIYNYVEQDDLIALRINRKGRVVAYRKRGYGTTDVCYLDFKPLSQEMLAEKLKVARERDSSIPKEPKQYTVRMNKTVCTYLYTEEM